MSFSFDDYARKAYRRDRARALTQTLLCHVKNGNANCLCMSLEDVEKLVERITKMAKEMYPWLKLKVKSVRYEKLLVTMTFENHPHCILFSWPLPLPQDPEPKGKTVKFMRFDEIKLIDTDFTDLRQKIMDEIRNYDSTRVLELSGEYSAALKDKSEEGEEKDE